jgi:hypothetical protein
MDMFIAETPKTTTVSTLPPRVPPEIRKPYRNCIPVYDLRFAAGTYGEFQVPDPDDVDWVECPKGTKPSMDFFIARVVGDSMNRVVPNGAWCLFRMNPAGSREKRIVLAQLRDYSDPEQGAAFTVKRYQRVGRGTGADELSGTIRLLPESTDPRFQVLEVPEHEDNVRVIAELVRVL